jgi:ferrous iron transport protein B
MEMPLYHIPNLRTIGLLVWQRSISFVKKAGTAILAMSLLVWALSYLPNGDLNTSLLAQLGHFLEPVGRWMGFDWRLTVALITSFPRRKISLPRWVCSLPIPLGSGLAATLASTFSTATALSFQW